MKNKLQILYNTLCLIDTKGESTKLMSECLKYTEQLIKEAGEAEDQAAEPKTKKEE